MCKLVKYSGSKNARSTAFDTHIATWVLVKDVIYEGVGMSDGSQAMTATCTTKPDICVGSVCCNTTTSMT